MYNCSKKKWRILIGGLLMWTLIGCAGGKPFDYKPTAGEMKDGPGLFTGEEGALTIYDSKKGEGFEKGSTKHTDDVRAQSGKVTQIPPAEAEEFMEFQKWKNENKEFQKFKEWKNSAQGSKEYQEFLEWKEWKSFKKWQNKQ